MSELSIRQEMDLNSRVDEIAEKIERRVNQAALDMSASTLEEYGYVKVVRCRDCEHYQDNHNNTFSCVFTKITSRAHPEGFCSWAVKRKGTENG